MFVYVGRSSESKLFAKIEVERERERERERETAWCLHTNLLLWLSFLEYRNTMFGSVNLITTASDEDPRAHWLLYDKVGHSTKLLTLWVLSIACTHFLN